MVTGNSWDAPELFGWSPGRDRWELHQFTRGPNRTAGQNFGLILMEPPEKLSAPRYFLVVYRLLKDTAQPIACEDATLDVTKTPLAKNHFGDVLARAPTVAGIQLARDERSERARQLGVRRSSCMPFLH
jgi:hypothetical protein